jgi:hypothetical protein
MSRHPCRLLWWVSLRSTHPTSTPQQRNRHYGYYPLDQVKRYTHNGNPSATRHLNNTVVLLTGQTFYQKRGLSKKLYDAPRTCVRATKATANTGKQAAMTYTSSP